MTEKAIDIGGGHKIEFVAYREDARAAINDYHSKPDGTECGGFVALRGGAWEQAFEQQGIPAWDVLSWEPLTLSPSLLCKACGSHGFIRNGKWVPA